jgi:hypothetical protein
MDFDDQLRRYFGTDDLAAVTPPAVLLHAQVDRHPFDPGGERGRRFALWSLMYLLGSAPDLDVAFKAEEDREAARDFMDMMDKAAPEG